MNSRELSLRKELAVVNLRVARAELLLARTKPDNLSQLAPLFDALSTLLEGRNLGRWFGYARHAFRWASVALNLRRSL